MFLVTAALVLTVDLWTKAWAFAFVDAHGTLYGGRAYPAWPPYFLLVKTENTGTIWGIGQGLPWLLIPIRILMVGVIVWFAWTARTTERLKLLALGARIDCRS